MKNTIDFNQQWWADGGWMIIKKKNMYVW
jgi:hypothetical protein